MKLLLEIGSHGTSLGLQPFSHEKRFVRQLQCIEKSKKEVNDEDLKYRVNFEEMQQAIAGMQNELQVFQERIEKIANRMQIVNPAHVADCFVNGNGEMLSYSELE
jgi:hypothetical protein